MHSRIKKEFTPFKKDIVHKIEYAHDLILNATQSQNKSKFLQYALESFNLSELILITKQSMVIICQGSHNDKSLRNARHKQNIKFRGYSIG